jgi:hypothetical protein
MVGLLLEKVRLLIAEWPLAGNIPAVRVAQCVGSTRFARSNQIALYRAPPLIAGSPSQREASRRRASCAGFTLTTSRRDWRIPSRISHEIIYITWCLLAVTQYRAA